MDYPNPNQTRKDPNQTRNRIYKYSDAAEIFKTKNPNRSETNPSGYPTSTSKLK